jgi:hypothetical protein
MVEDVSLTDEQLSSPGPPDLFDSGAGGGDNPQISTEATMIIGQIVDREKLELDLPTLVDRAFSFRSILATASRGYCPQKKLMDRIL